MEAEAVRPGKRSAESRSEMRRVTRGPHRSIHRNLFLVADELASRKEGRLLEELSKKRKSSITKPRSPNTTTSVVTPWKEKTKRQLTLHNQQGGEIQTCHPNGKLAHKIFWTSDVKRRGWGGVGSTGERISKARYVG